MNKLEAKRMLCFLNYISADVSLLFPFAKPENTLTPTGKAVRSTRRSPGRERREHRRPPLALVERRRDEARELPRRDAPERPPLEAPADLVEVHPHEVPDGLDPSKARRVPPRRGASPSVVVASTWRPVGGEEQARHAPYGIKQQRVHEPRRRLGHLPRRQHRPQEEDEHELGQVAHGGVVDPPGQDGGPRPGEVAEVVHGRAEGGLGVVPLGHGLVRGESRLEVGEAGGDFRVLGQWAAQIGTDCETKLNAPERNKVRSSNSPSS